MEEKITFKGGSVYTLEPGAVELDRWLYVRNLGMDDIESMSGDVLGQVDPGELRFSHYVDEIGNYLFSGKEAFSQTRYTLRSYKGRGATMGELVNLMLRNGVIGDRLTLSRVSRDKRDLLLDYMLEEFDVSVDDAVMTRGILDIDWRRLQKSYEDDGYIAVGEPTDHDPLFYELYYV